jgi:spore protease
MFKKGSKNCIKQEHFEVRTDLALEVNEEVSGSEGKLNGVIVDNDIDKESNIKITTLKITNSHGAKILGKAMGTYVTIEAEELSNCDEDYSKKASDILEIYIKKLLDGMIPNTSKCSLLIVGLGNRQVTADALGPLVVENLSVNHHIYKDNTVTLAALSPGVMAQTGMETAQIIKGIVKETMPDVVIAIDALAARDSKRLNTTIQISDRGINPGSGVGNHRVGITRENIGVPVLAIGVPTVIDAPTIVNDTMENLISLLAQVKELESVADVLSEYTPSEKYSLIKEIIAPEMSEMYVTPKDIDANIKIISYILSDAINQVAGIG